VDDTGIPVADIPAPLTFTAEIVTVALPVFVMETVFVDAAPVAMLPKLKLVGDADIVNVCAVPVPVNAIVVGVLEPLLVSETDPLAAPAACGAN